MKRIAVLISDYTRHITAAILSLAAVIVPFAANAGLTISSGTSQLNQILLNIQGTLTIVIQVLMTLAFVVFIWGIVRFIAAAGNPQQLKTAKGTMLYGIIALAVLAMITGIILFLQTYFGIPGGGSISVPQF